MDYIAKNPDKQIYVGDNVTFYLSDDGEILYSKLSATAMNLGYIAAAETDTIEKITRIMLYNTSNKMTVLDCRDTVIINGEAVKYDKVVEKLENSCALTNKDPDAVGTAVFATGEIYHKPMII